METLAASGNETTTPGTAPATPSAKPKALLLMAAVTSTLDYEVLQEEKVELEKQRQINQQKESELQKRHDLLRREEENLSHRRKEIETVQLKLVQHESELKQQQMQLDKGFNDLKNREREVSTHCEKVRQQILNLEQQNSEITEHHQTKIKLKDELRTLQLLKENTSTEVQKLKETQVLFQREWETQQQRTQDLIEQRAALDADEERLAEQQQLVSKKMEEVFKSTTDGSERMKKRKVVISKEKEQSDFTSMAAPLQLSNVNPFETKSGTTDLKIEQDDEVLMHGRAGVWDHTDAIEEDEFEEEFDVDVQNGDGAVDVVEIEKSDAKMH